VAERLARFLDAPAGPLELVAVKGKNDPVAAQRVCWFPKGS
jgi:adenylate cyclase